MNNEEIRITVSDAREYFNGCIPGWKTFAETHGFDWKTVVRHGLTAQELLNTNDIMAINLVNWVKNGRRK